jgi:hypothetical protein
MMSSMSVISIDEKGYWKRDLRVGTLGWHDIFPNDCISTFQSRRYVSKEVKQKKDLIEVCDDTFGDRYNKLDKWIWYRKGTLRNRLNQEIWNRNLGGKMSSNSPLSDQWTQRQINRQKDGQTGEGMEGWGERLTYEGKDLQTNKKIDRQTDRWTKTDKWT